MEVRGAGLPKSGGPAAARWLTDKYLHAMLLVFPLFTGFKGYGGITASKFIFFASVTGLWLLLVGALGLAGAVKAGKKPKMPRLSPVQWAVTAFMAVCCVSAAVSPHQDSVLLGAGRYDGLVTLLLYGGVFLGVSLTGEPKRSYIFSLGLSTAACCVVALLQLFDLNALWLFPKSLGYHDAGILYTGEFLGTIGNANLLSAFLCLGIPLFGGAFVAGERKTDWLFLVPAFLGLFVLAVSGVSGGAVALGACALLCAPALLTSGQRVLRALLLGAGLLVSLAAALALPPDPEARSLVFSPGLFCYAALGGAAVCAAAFALLSGPGFDPSPRALRRFFICVSALGVLAFLALAWFWPGTGGTLYELSQALRGNLQDSFGSSRIRIWRAVLALVPERPLLGGGPDTLALRLSVTFSRYVPETGVTLSTFVDNAHNEYLGYLANLGVLGLGCYLAAMVLTLAGLLRRRSRSPLPAVCGCALICYWIQGFFGLGLCITAPILWALWGLTASRAGKDRENTTISEVST